MIIFSTLLIIFLAFLGYETVEIVPVAFHHYFDYRWVALGIICYWPINHFAKHNLAFVKTFTHELSHTLTALLTGRRVHSFSAKEREGVVWSSGNGVSLFFTTLAPYCLPFYTYALLLIWSLIASETMPSRGALAVFDVLIGLSIGLHASCFWEQTRRDQPDIKSYPLFFSYLFIWTFRLFNLLIILLTFLPDGGKGPMKLWGAFWYMLKSLWQLICDII